VCVFRANKKRKGDEHWNVALVFKALILGFYLPWGIRILGSETFHALNLSTMGL
jgi:hypothetical protein